MNDLPDEKWQMIKTLASRLQAIKNILEIFGTQVNNQPFANELKPIREQLEADFDRTLTALLELIDNGDENTHEED